MKAIIVQSSKPLSLVGAGPACIGDLQEALAIAPYLVAADGGAELALKCGNIPDKLIGDFDSILPDSLAKIPTANRHRVCEQSSTDLEKCLTRIKAPLILAVGFLGGRLDHQLAALNAIARHQQSPCVLLGEQDLVFHLRGQVTFQLTPGLRLSLFPLAPVRGSSQGLEWPIDGLDFTPGGQIGTSNSVTDGAVHLMFEDPGMLVIMPRAALSAVVAGLLR